MMKAIIESLRSLDLSDGGSHSRLSAIASCFFQPTFGWTGGSCEELRNVLIEILEDTDGNDNNYSAHDCNCTHHRCNQRQVSYDVLGNERHKAVCELRKVCTKLDESVWTWIEDVAIAIGAQDNQSDEYESMLPKITDRLIHLLDGVHKPDAALPTYDVLGNERHKAVCRLREIEIDAGGFVKALAEAIGVEWQAPRVKQTIAEVRDRLIHLLSGDQPTLSDLYGILQDGEESESRGSESVSEMTKNAETINLGDKSNGELMENGENHKIASITDELRKFKGHINTRTTPEMVLALRAEINCIADRIDERARLGDIKADIWQDYANQMRAERDNLLDLIGDAAKEYKMLDQMSAETSANFHAMRDRVWGIEAERDELQEKCDRLNEKVEHQREQLAVYATMCDFEAIRALKRERNEHKHRADNAEGHAKSLDRRLDAAHETYCALLNDAAREFRALTAERDELLAKLDDYDRTHVELPKDENDEYIHIGDVMDGYAKTIEVVELRYGRSGWVLISRDGNGYTDTFAFAHHHEPTVEQVIRDLTFGKITESQAIERIEGIHG